MATNPFINLSTQFTSSVDPVVDSTPFWQGSTSEAFWINRNTYLNLASQPVGISDTQTLTNKTLTTPTLSVNDGSFTVQNSSDTTKKAVLSLASISTGTTRTFTLPNVSDTLVTLGATQTLTSKTLTSPSISGGTIDNATVTVDAVAGHTTSNTGTIYGISVTTGTIGSAALASGAVTSTAIAAGAVQPNALTASTGTSWSWQTWTPTWANIAGQTVNFATYIQIGKTVFYKLKITLTGTNISGAPTFTFPTTLASNFNGLQHLGQGYAQHSSGAFYILVVTPNSSTVGILNAQNVGSTYIALTQVSATVPFTWGSGDVFCISGNYETS